MKSIRIISRKSELALWQANFVKEELLKHYPDIHALIIGITTKGDTILDRSLDKIGGKGLFIKELENALLNDTADIAVHSLKDLPAKLDDRFNLAAILKREDAADAFLSDKYASLDDMPVGSVIGTSSARRIAILKQYYPHLQIKLLRGNLQTRIAKLEDGEYDAIILAVAGLNRLELNGKIKQKLSLDKFIPAIGQGALAIEISATRTDLLDILRPLQDYDTNLAVNTERSLGEKLGASCSVPIAIYSCINQDSLSLSAKIWDVESGNFCEAQTQVAKSRAIDAVDYCMDMLIKQDVKSILAKY